MISKTKNIGLFSKNYPKNVYKLLKKKKIVKTQKIVKIYKKMVYLPSQTNVHKKIVSLINFNGKKSKALKISKLFFSKIWVYKKLNPYLYIFQLNNLLGLRFRLLTTYKSGKAVPLSVPLSYTSFFSFFLKSFVKISKTKKGSAAFSSLLSSVLIDPTQISILNNKQTLVGLKARKYNRFRW